MPGGALLRISLFYKILFLSILVLSLSLGFGYMLLEHQILRQTRIQIEKDNRLLLLELTRSLSLPLLKNDRMSLEDNLGVFEHSPGVLGVYVFDRQGVLKGRIENDTIGGNGIRNLASSPFPGPGGETQNDLVFRHFKKRHLYRLSTPILFQGVEVGKVSLFLSDAPYEAVRARIARSFLILGGGSLMVAFLGSLFLSAYISRPIRSLRNATERILEGDFVRVPLPALKDETGDLVVAFNRMALDMEHKERLEKALIRYVSRDVAEHLISHPELIHLGGIRQEVVLIFADIRNFTRLSSQLPSEEVVQILNDYFNSFIDEIFLHHGSVNNIMGDGIMIVFGIPQFSDSHPDNALACALSIRNRIQDLSESRKKGGLPSVQFGLGLHIGEGVVGHIGSKTRMEYTVVGGAVNIAYRIQEEAGPGEILVSDSLWQRLSGNYDSFRQTSRQVTPKGLDEPVLVHVL